MTSQRFGHRTTWRQAFTLLEVLLTLSMSVVLMILVGGAIQFYARDMNVRDMDIRQTQLASAVMQMIEDDLRATLHSDPVDMSGLEALLSSVGGGSGGGSGGGGGGGGGADESDLSAAGIDSQETALDGDLSLASGVAVLESPGLIGDQYQIQIDLSRLPRLEEYVAMLDGTVADLEDIPSDLKTVAYYVQGEGVLGGVQDPLDALSPDSATTGRGGLVRRSLDRAATVEASMNNSLSRLDQTGELLAPEITGIEFSYWDGVKWQIQWSSDYYGELPLAVMVKLYMANPVAQATAGTSFAASSATDQSVRTFTHIVRLPLARPIEQDLSTETGL